ncbi:(2Fe-2S)-binding protein [Phytoactinopolyspora halophila]|uniref:(2Fe-2S)-binding protein n=1 Tax=Phytoactinopolyspora halophila TaxID=1981511 RepID=UPI001B8B86C7|nr:(2Fe-2S)-binding protein [Phytoactinopolyspora halophila]
MTVPPFPVPPSQDPIRPDPGTSIRISVDETEYPGRAGQTIAGVMLAAGLLSWRYSSGSGAPRGAFCGIGVCFDCLATVNGQRDVRTCQRRAVDGDVVVTQHDPLPRPPRAPAPESAAESASEPAHRSAPEPPHPSGPDSPLREGGSGA